MVGKNDDGTEISNNVFSEEKKKKREKYSKMLSPEIFTQSNLLVLFI